MPESNRPLVERIARVLAGAAHSSNAEGDTTARATAGVRNSSGRRASVLRPGVISM